jgi:hypothetical protein
MIIIMWARVCIVLHNLIIHIEGDNFDETWRESLVRRGMDHEPANGDIDEDEPEDKLEGARRRVQTDG